MNNMKTIATLSLALAPFLYVSESLAGTSSERLFCSAFGEYYGHVKVMSVQSDLGAVKDLRTSADSLNDIIMPTCYKQIDTKISYDTGADLGQAVAVQLSLQENATRNEELFNRVKTSGRLVGLKL